MSNGLTQTRTLLTVLKKSDMCQCGCHGFCSWGHMQRVLVWSFNCLAKGKYPATDHLDQPFPFGDDRALYRDFDLYDGFAGAVVEFRADLLELTGVTGVKTWKNPLNPCICCSSTRPHGSQQLWGERTQRSRTHSVLLPCVGCVPAACTGSGIERFPNAVCSPFRCCLPCPQGFSFRFPFDSTLVSMDQEGRRGLPDHGTQECGDPSFEQQSRP